MFTSLIAGFETVATQVKDVFYHRGNGRAGAVAAGSDALTSVRDDHAISSTWNLRGKRVAMVVFSYYKFDPRVRRAADALAGQGMSVDVICLRPDKDTAKHEILNGVRLRRVSIQRQRGGILGYVYQYCAFLLVSSAIIAVRSLKSRYDLVYVHNMPDFLVLAGLIPKAYGAKVILDIHDPMPELMRTIFGLPEEAKAVRLLKMSEKWSIALADSVITVNRACARILSSRSCPPKKVTVVMNSPDERIFGTQCSPPAATSKNPGRPFVIMYHGSLVERNGLDLAISAFAHARASIPGAELWIYGERNAFLELVMDNARKLGLEGAVHYRGRKTVEQIAEAIEQCDVGVIPNQRNIFTELNTPTRIFEYLAKGKPVIAPRSPGICDYFDEESLIFFELGDVQDLARKMCYASERPNEVLQTTRRGQEVHRAHTWREERLRLTGLVGDVLRRNRSLTNDVVEAEQRQEGQSKEGVRW